MLKDLKEKKSWGVFVINQLFKVNIETGGSSPRFTVIKIKGGKEDVIFLYFSEVKCDGKLLEVIT